MAESSTALTVKANSPARLPAELWCLVGEHVLSIEDLKHLVQVCRAFHGVFQDFLYRKHSFGVTDDVVPQLFTKNQYREPYMCHIRDLEINFGHYKFEEFENHLTLRETRELSAAYDIFLANAIKHMPMLTTFRWADSDDHGHSTLAHKDSSFFTKSKLFNEVKDCRTLKHLSISMYKNDDRLRRNRRCNPCRSMTQSLKGVHHLTSLELYQMDGVDPKLAEDVACLLRDSPALRLLGLSHCHKDGEARFFQDVCQQYTSDPDTKPLALKTLKLGENLINWPRTAQNYLQGMVQLDKLEILHLDNIEHSHRLYPWNGNTFNSSVNWRLFEDCKTIKQLAVTKLDRSSSTWINDRPNITELFLTNSDCCKDQHLQWLKTLKLPKLTMLYAKQTPPGPCDRVDPIYLLDLLHDGGVQLNRLSLCIRTQDQRDQFLNKLRTLTLLKHLRIDSIERPATVNYAFETEEAVMHFAKLDYIFDTEEAAMNFAKLAKSLCPLLQYVQIRGMAWEVTVADGTAVVFKKEDLGQFLLRRLDEGERLSIELFSLECSGWAVRYAEQCLI